MQNFKEKIDRLSSVGIIHCSDIPKEELRYGQEACIEIFDKYMPAINRMKEHDYLWVLCWLDKADRDLLQTYSWHLREERDMPYGVFSLRSPCRPNPISLTLVKLLKIEKRFIYVDGLDVFNGTLVLDIKPYTKSEIVFSPQAPYIRPQNSKFLQMYYYKKALLHHREECIFLSLAVRMAIVAEEYLGDLTADDIILHVEGSPCFADAIQGITNARLANPARFYYQNRCNGCLCIWERAGARIVTESKITDFSSYTGEQIDHMGVDELLHVQMGDTV